MTLIIMPLGIQGGHNPSQGNSIHITNTLNMPQLTYLTLG